MAMNSAPASLTKRCPQCGTLWGQEGKPVPSFCLDCLFPLLVVGGRYVMERRIPSGGFGVVYLAQDLKCERQVVVKTLRTELYDQDEWELRFQREIRVTALLSEKNKHVVALLQHGREKGLGFYYVMEHLDGVSLTALLKRNEPLSFSDSFHIFHQLCEALEHAHTHDVVHRDLKPDNILLVKEEGDPLFVKILDFGIAKVMRGTAHPNLTQNPVGTPLYMAPEQFMGLPIDRRTDVYISGLLLYELLTRSQPFASQENSMRKQIRLHCVEPPIPIRERCPTANFPQGLEDSVLRALAKKPEARYQSMEEFWQAIEPFVSLPGSVLPA